MQRGSRFSWNKDRLVFSRKFNSRQGDEMARGFAVLDFETTGILPSRGHRVLEIGLVLLDEKGRFEDEWTTLVNPKRDLGPTSIHGLKGVDVEGAGTFADYSPTLVRLLAGRVLVAHNAPFDIRFLNAELSRIGVNSPFTSDDLALDTLSFASSVLPGAPRSLEACCAAVGVQNPHAHTALSDARATAALFKCLMDSCLSPNAVDELLGVGDALSWPTLEGPERDQWLRGMGQERSRGILAASAQRARPHVITQGENAFVALLEEVLSDGVITVEESQALLDAATELGLSKQRLQVLRLEFFARLVEQAWEDGILTEEEQASIRSVGAWMSISGDDLERALLRDGSGLSRPSVYLNEGDAVVLTGEMSKPRSFYEGILEARGFRIASAVSKKVKLVLVADPDSLSGKATKGRELGIPLMHIDEFLLTLT
jgi:DNA polymerase-3 subunit epsilon